MTSNLMQAVRIHQYGGPEELRLEQLPVPVPKPEEVLIRVHAVGVLPVDWAYRQGLMKEHVPLQLPFISGSAVAGVVADVGSRVSKFRKGQAVFGRASQGACAEFVTTTVDTLASLPPNLSFREAATISGGATTAWMALFAHGHLQPGQRVLIHAAAGGVGSYAVQLAKWKGAEVIGTCSGDHIDYVKSLGADTVIDYRTTRFEDRVHDVDLVLDGVGGDTLERSWSIVRRGGTLLSLVDVPSTERAQQLGITARFSNELAPDTVFQQIGQLIADGQIKAPVGKEFPLHEIRQAHELCQTGHGRGRIVLRVAD
ncbi:NADP-dependent oxidoreductase [Paenibacillus cellulositrophicus]|uniref:NADP-dependent oxidoreductase n=1 Tax=Paenibacillus cellulositrophicus TaxID=562959 RepID=UPI0020421C15|nr:NADP-dependent oxidoreductase [Paenibacillus cellulositrophicus]MCM3000063.1 NADP-dependent oxidoreductase [Paenibacillus cellulositrophicus]